MPDNMMIDMGLFAWLAVAVAVVGAWMWLKPRPNGKSTKFSGIGDQGQHDKK